MGHCKEYYGYGESFKKCFTCGYKHICMWGLVVLFPPSEIVKEEFNHYVKTVVGIPNNTPREERKNDY